MRTLRVFQEGVDKLFWIEAAAAYTRGWLWTQDLFQLAESGRLPVDEDDEVLLYLMKEAEWEQLAAGLQKLIKKYDGVDVPIDDLRERSGGSLISPYKAVLPWVWDIWLFEFCLKIYASSYDQYSELEALLSHNSDIFLISISDMPISESIYPTIDVEVFRERVLSRRV